MVQETADTASMLALQAGQTAELGTLFERHHQPLYRFCYRMTGNPGISEDLVQEVFVRILRYRETFRPDSDFKAWLFALARNACHDHFRRSRVRSIEIGVDPEDHSKAPSSDPSPDRVFDDRESSERLHRALLCLSPEQRELIVLTRLEFRKHRDIAALLGCTEGAVKVRLHRAVRQLRKHFQRLETEVCP